jgi:hypothetical protein
MPILFADWQAIWPRLVGLAVIALVVVGPIGAIWIKRAGTRRLAALRADAATAANAAAGPPVAIRFHTYHGLVVFFVQTTHEVELPAACARSLLARLHRFNCTWGLLCPGLIFIPLLSLAEYRSQLRVIEAQHGGD